jgi:archaellum biogenesis ATPase FlaH
MVRHSDLREAGRGLLSAIMQQPGEYSISAYREACRIGVTVDHFSGEDRALWLAAGLLADEGAAISEETLALKVAEARPEGRTIPDGYADRVRVSVIDWKTADYRANALVRLRREADLRSALEAAARQAPSSSPEELDGLLDNLIASVRGARVATDPPGLSAEACVEAYFLERSRGDSGVVRTPIHDLTERLAGGFRPGQLVVLAGRPGMGKSALALDLALEAGRDGRVAFFSLEMTAADFGERIAKQNLRSDEEAWRRAATARVSASQLHLVSEGAWTVEKIRDYALNMRDTDGLRMLVVDHLGLLTPSSATRGRTREQEVAHFSRSLKALAKELEVPILALSQLNRGSENREDRGPRLSDLRDSGAIEQDADVVMGLFRPSYYDHALEGEPDEIRLLKVRQGRAGTCPARFDGPSMSWRGFVPQATYSY